jgi:dipeptidyl aminopeptidase/acylaminoacyl peptidase
MFRNTVLATAVACAMLPVAASAQDAAALFAKDPEYQQATLSPTGAYVAVATPFEDRRALSLIKLSGNYDRSVIKFDVGPDRWGDIIIPIPGDAHWVDDNRLIVSKFKDYGRLKSRGGGLVFTGDIYAANADGSEQTQLFGYVPDRGRVRTQLKDEGVAGLLKVVPDSKGQALFWFYPWTTGNSTFTYSVFSVDTYRGLRKQVDSFDNWIPAAADNNGKVRFLNRRDLDAIQHVRYRPQPDGAMVDAPESLVGSAFYVLGFDSESKYAYAQISDKGEPGSLYRVEMATGKRERLGGDATFEPQVIETAGEFGPPVVVMYTAGKPRVEYIDPNSEWSKLHAGLMKVFPGQLVNFAGLTRDEKTVLLYVYSDRNPGNYYLFDRKTNKPSLLFETMSWIEPAKMSPMTPVEFKNRGGVAVHGFFTAPAGRKGPHPLVVMPHGGPFGPYDTWSFNPDVQFLASQGYAVLQVNFRGSGGRGDLFENATYRQWGTGIQDDIADAVKHVIAQNMADPGKVCIYGGSFGGYSAMMNPIRNPGMYKCAIGYAGVYDLARMRSDNDSSKQDRAWFPREVANDEAQVSAQSPVNLVSKLDVPMLLIHGKSDQVANFAQFTIAESALKKAGKPYETLVKAGEGHGFYKEENRADAYRKIAAFLAKYNPVD